MATAAQTKKFISEIAPIIQKYAKKYSYKVASPIIAQAILESASGTSSLGYKYHNYFGMKAGSSKTGKYGAWDGSVVNLSTKEEYTPGTLTSIKSLFRVYKSMDEGVHGYFEFIGTYSRYKNLLDATTAKDYLEKIKADGYATSSGYVTNNMAIVEKYNLTQYDNLQTDISSNNEETLSYTVGKKYELLVDLYVRNTANGTKKLYSALTADGKKHGRADENGFAILKKGTLVTCKDVTTSGKSVWLKIPSGYICAMSAKGTVYIK